MDTAAQRRYVILTEGQFGDSTSKTARGVIKYAHDRTVAVLDSAYAGRNVSEWMGPAHDIPIVATLAEALLLAPDTLLIGVAPRGGKVPQEWRAVIAGAITAGLDIVSGLHEFLSDDPEFSALAAARGVELIDHRRPPERHEVTTGRVHRPGSTVVLTVGSDCAIGKMTVALELRNAAIASGLTSVLVPTGQTGIMIEGWGVAIDRTIADFSAGTAEWLVEQAEGMADWIFVEGQGSIDHPSYSSVTLSLVHGTTPHAMVLVHQPGRVERAGWEGQGTTGSLIKSVPENIRLYEVAANMIAPSQVAAVALNTQLLTEDQARAEIAAVAEATGLPVDDPYRFGPERLFAGLRARIEAARLAEAD